jgi:hypothetical protein
VRILKLKHYKFGVFQKPCSFSMHCASMNLVHLEGQKFPAKPALQALGIWLMDGRGFDWCSWCRADIICTNTAATTRKHSQNLIAFIIRGPGRKTQKLVNSNLKQHIFRRRLCRWSVRQEKAHQWAQAYKTCNKWIRFKFGSRKTLVFGNNGRK